MGRYETDTAIHVTSQLTVSKVEVGDSGGVQCVAVSGSAVVTSGARLVLLRESVFWGWGGIEVHCYNIHRQVALIHNSLSLSLSAVWRPTCGYCCWHRAQAVSMLFMCLGHVVSSFYSVHLVLQL